MSGESAGLDLGFIIATALILFTYMGYPIVCRVCGVLSKNSQGEKDNITSVAIILPMHNAAQLVLPKVESLKALTLQRACHVYFVLDGCEDLTSDVLRECVKDLALPHTIIESKRRIGKEAAIRLALESVTEQALVFSDADATWDTNCVEELVQSLEGQNIGAVCGREIHTSTESATAAQGQGLFYRYEEFIKRSLMNAGTLPYVQGGNFALRSDLYPPTIPAGCTQDGIIAFYVAKMGFRVVFNYRAVSREPYDVSTADDFSRRVRTINRAFYSIICSAYVFNPFKTRDLIFHILFGRVMRWMTLFLAFFVLIAGLISEVTLINTTTAVGAILVLILFSVGALSEFGFTKRDRVTYFVYYFVYIHAAAARAIVETVLGKRRVTWTPTTK